MMLLCFFGIVMAGSAERMFDLVNLQRARYNAKSLLHSKYLQKVAQTQADYICKRMKLTHSSPKGTLQDRINSADEEFIKSGENIAKSQGKGPDEVVNQWLKHEPHRRTMLGSYTHTGIGTCEDKREHTYWVQVFGRKKAKPNEAAESPNKSKESSNKSTTGPERYSAASSIETDDYIIIFKAKSQPSKYKTSTRINQAENNTKSIKDLTISSLETQAHSKSNLKTFSQAESKTFSTSIQPCISTIISTVTISPTISSKSTVAQTYQANADIKEILKEFKDEIIEEITKVVRKPNNTEKGKENKSKNRECKESKNKAKRKESKSEDEAENKANKESKSKDEAKNENKTENKANKESKSKNKESNENVNKTEDSIAELLDDPEIGPILKKIFKNGTEKAKQKHRNNEESSVDIGSPLGSD